MPSSAKQVACRIKRIGWSEKFVCAVAWHVRLLI
jgi:hypothetical protein